MAAKSKSSERVPVTSQLSKRKCRVARSVTTSDGESDLLVVYQDESDATRTAILIEDKIRAAFQERQAERYQLRGLAGVAGQDWDVFFTCLVCPSRYTSNNAGFDARITLEQLGKFFTNDATARSEYKSAVIQSAVKAANSTGIQLVDPVMTAFRKMYADASYSEFLGTKLVPDSAREAWSDDTWFLFRTSALPGDVKIVHKAKAGVVQLNFPSLTLEELSRKQSSYELPPGMELVVTGKGSSYQLTVPKIDSFVDLPRARTKLREAFEAVKVLSAHYLQESLLRASDRAEAQMMALLELLNGLIRARALSFREEILPMQFPTLATLLEARAQPTFIKVPGIAGGFEILLIASDGRFPVLFVESGSRIASGFMHHAITSSSVESEDFLEFEGESLQEFAARWLSRRGQNEDRSFNQRT